MQLKKEKRIKIESGSPCSLTQSINDYFFNNFFPATRQGSNCFTFSSFLFFLLHFYSINNFSSGINKWRDSRTPKQILEKYCETSNFPKPKYIGNTKIILHGDEFCLEDFGKLLLKLLFFDSSGYLLRSR